MDKDVAIKLLKAQKDKLQDQNLDEVHWVDETSNIVAGIFGKDSDHYTQIQELDIGIPDYSTYDGDNNPMRNRNRAEKYLNSYITEIKNIPLRKSADYNPEKDYKLSKSIFWIAAPLFLSGVFALGLYFGGAKFDQEKIDFVDEIKKLKSDTIALSSKLKSKDSIINEKNRHISLVVDSLRHSQKDADALLFYLGTLKKK